MRVYMYVCVCIHTHTHARTHLVSSENGIMDISIHELHVVPCIQPQKLNKVNVIIRCKYSAQILVANTCNAKSRKAAQKFVSRE